MSVSFAPVHDEPSRPLRHRTSNANKVINMLPSDGSFSLSSEEKLQLHALRNQINTGPAPSASARPTFVNVVARAQWEAWYKLGNISRSEAMERFVRTTRQILDKNGKHPEAPRLLALLDTPYVPSTPVKSAVSTAAAAGAATRVVAPAPPLGGLDGAPGLSIETSRQRTDSLNSATESIGSDPFASVQTPVDIKLNMSSLSLLPPTATPTSASNAGGESPAESGDASAEGSSSSVSTIIGEKPCLSSLSATTTSAAAVVPAPVVSKTPAEVILALESRIAAAASSLKKAQANNKQLQRLWALRFWLSLLPLVLFILIRNTYTAPIFRPLVYSLQYLKGSLHLL